MLEDIIALVLGLGLPIVTVVMCFSWLINKKKSETELRKTIVENNIDAETARLLLENPSAKKVGGNHYGTLTWGLALLGFGLALLVITLAGFQPFQDGNEHMFMIGATVGFGIGLLAAFIVIMKLKKKSRPETKSEAGSETDETE